MTRPRLRVLGYSKVVLAAVAILSAGTGAATGCSAKPSGSSTGGIGGGQGGAGGSGTTTTTNNPNGGAGGSIFPVGGGAQGGGTPACDSGLGNVDDDMDGFSEEQGDCNDCDPNAN